MQRVGGRASDTIAAMSPTSAPPAPSIEAIRAQFPALEDAQDVFLDNAGGAQVPRGVAEAIHRYMTTNYVQLGADYETSRRCTDLVDRAHAFTELILGAPEVGHVVLGGSMTALTNMLADCVARSETAGRDQIVISELAHESNAGPWARLAQRGFEVRTWHMDRDSRRMRLEDLESILSARTRIVAMPHVSNLLGAIEDVEGAIALAHEAGAEVVVDGVAMAPHRAVDVGALGVDWYSIATYKIFGPHMGALFGRREAMERLPSGYHDFIPGSSGAYRFEQGGANHESCAGWLGLWEYLAFLAGADAEAEPSRDVIERAFEVMTSLESVLQARLIDGLRSIKGVRIVGPTNASINERVSTVSFVHESMRSQEISRRLGAQGFGVRFGHCYSRRLAQRLFEWGDLHDVEDGVMRVSLVHYNTGEEIERLLDALEQIVTSQ